MQVSGFKTLIKDRRLLALAAAADLFHLGNAAMLPLAGQQLSEELWSQLTFQVGGHHRRTNGDDRCRLVVGSRLEFVGAQARFPPRLHRLAYTRPAFALGSNSAYLLSVQTLDGVGAGIFGVVSIIMIADLTQGTGRFNVTQGAIATAQGMGASLSNSLGEFLLGSAGFSAAFATPIITAVVGLAVFWLFVPETKQLASTEPELEVAASEVIPVR